MLDNPAAYDIINKLCAAWRKEYVPVAQLDRVSDSDSEGRGFESRRAYHIKKPVLSMLCSILTLAVFIAFYCPLFALLRRSCLA